MKSSKGPMILFLMVVGFVVYLLLGVARKPERSHVPQGEGKPRKAAMTTPDQMPSSSVDAGSTKAIFEGELHPGQIVAIPVRNTTPNRKKALAQEVPL